MIETKLVYISIGLAIAATLLAAYLFVQLVRMQGKLRSIFGETNPDKRFSLKYYLDKLLQQKSILELNTVGREISSSAELTQVLTQIAKAAKSLFKCQFVELSLIDEENEIYHSACSIGQPVSYTPGTSDFDQVIKPVSFSGQRFGILRLVFNKKNALTPEENELLDLLVVQTSIAILNSRYSDEILQMKQMSEESVKAKTGFLANLSHELRGPLGIILNAVEIVLGGICGPIEPMQEKTLTMVKKNGDHLLDLINDVLDYAKVEAGKVIPDIKALSVNDLLTDIVKLVSSQAIQKSHKLSAEETKETLILFSDRRHIRQILINFLTNAVKYTPEGGEIAVWAERVPGNRIKISVKDTGVGISEDQKQYVFTAFQRLDDEYSKKQAGTGLGLSLTQKLAAANNGKIGFDSKSGEGSTFWLVLDAATEQDLGDEKVEKEIVPKKANGQKVLVIEPNIGEGEVLKGFLENYNYQVILDSEFSKGKHNSETFSALVIENNYLDDHHPEFLSELKSELGDESLPVILLTSRAFEFDTEKYLKLGVDICLNKPFKMGFLANKLELLLKI